MLKKTVNKKWVRKNHSIIWGSSYDRGLPYLLQMWPDIKKEVPDAELHIYYGWDLYLAVHKNNPARMQWKAKVEELMKQDGIVVHGRVGHSELERAFYEAGIWAYPTDFTEISCISAMKAQSFGAFPVCTNFAALKETVQFGERIDVDITEKEGQDEYKKVLIDFLKNKSGDEKARLEMMEWAQEKYSWANVAQKWDNLFKGGDK
jgi:glycosyltransferase involved in cell wall biosynthesis